MHSEDRSRRVADRLLVVGEPRAVRRPDLDEPRARAREDVRDPEAVADLDQLAARDDHLAAFGESRQREENGRRVVVDHERGLGAGQVSKQRRDVILPRAAGAGGEVVLEIRVAAPDFDDPLQRLLCERGATQVRMNEDSGRVQRTPEPGNFQRVQLVKNTMNQVSDIATGPRIRARVRERVSDRGHDELPSVLRRQRRDGIVREEAVDRRKVSEGVFPCHGPDDREPVRGVRSRSW